MRRYVAAFGELRGKGDEGRDALAVLLADERACVRVTTAVFLLRHSGHRERTVVEHESKGQGLIAFEAAQTLWRWEEEGDWSLDPLQSERTFS